MWRRNRSERKKTNGMRGREHFIMTKGKIDRYKHSERKEKCCHECHLRLQLTFRQIKIPYKEISHQAMTLFLQFTVPHPPSIPPTLPRSLTPWLHSSLFLSSIYLYHSLSVSHFVSLCLQHSDSKIQHIYQDIPYISMHFFCTTYLRVSLSLLSILNTITLSVCPFHLNSLFSVSYGYNLCYFYIISSSLCLSVSFSISHYFPASCNITTTYLSWPIL